MSDGFRPEILAAFMQQVVDAPTIPNLFMRTVSGTARTARLSVQLTLIHGPLG